LAVDQIPDGKIVFGPDKNSSAAGKGFLNRAELYKDQALLSSSSD
jgi:hypothetical protein